MGNKDHWFEKWLEENDIPDKDSPKRNTETQYSNKPFKKNLPSPQDFPIRYKKTNKFYNEGENTLEKWLDKNDVYDKDKWMGDDMIWRYPPQNLTAIQIDSSIDLHQLTVSQAIQILKKFITDSFKKNDCVVKVIHGKGNHSFGGPKVKIAVIEWLRKEGKGYIRFFKEASVNHGGAGATIVWLK